MTLAHTVRDVTHPPLTLSVALRSVLFAFLFYSTTTIFLIIGSPLLLAPRHYAMSGLRLHAMTCLRLLHVICNIRYEVRGHERLPASACLVAAKHQSTWDTFALVPLLVDPTIVLKAELLWIPLYGAFCRKFEHIAIVRERAAVALKQLLGDARSRLAEGRQILIFPEGSRRYPGDPPDYKPGVVAVYETAGVACVPVALNSGMFWARRSLWRFPGTIIVEFLEPIPPGLPRRIFREQLIERLEMGSNRLMDEAIARRTRVEDAGLQPSNT